jgi:hypothetical protein
VALDYLQQVVGTRPPSDASEFGYPALSTCFVMKTGATQFHIIFGAAADTMTTAGIDGLYANAPNGSIYISMDSNTTKKIFIKFGNIGLANGSFLGSSAAYATVT